MLSHSSIFYFCQCSGPQPDESERYCCKAKQYELKRNTIGALIKGDHVFFSFFFLHFARSKNVCVWVRGLARSKPVLLQSCKKCAPHMEELLLKPVISA